jgi:hypothetical protein
LSVCLFHITPRDTTAVSPSRRRLVPDAPRNSHWNLLAKLFVATSCPPPLMESCALCCPPLIKFRLRALPPGPPPPPLLLCLPPACCTLLVSVSVLVLLGAGGGADDGTTSWALDATVTVCPPYKPFKNRKLLASGSLLAPGLLVLVLSMQLPKSLLRISHGGCHGGFHGGGGERKRKVHSLCSV